MAIVMTQETPNLPGDQPLSALLSALLLSAWSKERKGSGAASGLPSRFQPPPPPPRWIARQRLLLQPKSSPQFLLLLRAGWDSAVGFPLQFCNFHPIWPPRRPLTPAVPARQLQQAKPKQPERNSELSLGVSGPGDRKSGEPAMSGRWRGRESSPHSPPTAELGWGHGARRGLGSAPQAPAPPRSLGFWSRFPARIPARGTQPALSPRQPEWGAAASGASEGRRLGRAPPRAALLGPRSPSLGARGPHPSARAVPAASALRPPPAPLRPSFLLPESSSPAQAAPSRPLPREVRGSPTPAGSQARRGRG